MKKLLQLLALLCLSCLVSCSLLFPSNTTINSYKLDGLNTQSYATKPHKKVLLVSIPTAAAGYGAQDMLYMDTMYKLMPFAKNQWLAPPHQMLQPLLVQSLRNSNYFSSVVPAPLTAKTALRLDTQLVRLQQNFVSKPSQVELTIQTTLINANNNHVIASKRFTVQVSAPSDDPYGGVIAANTACAKIMQEITAFVVHAA